MKIAILGVKTFPALAGADRVVEKYIENAETSDIFYIYLSKVDNEEKLNCNQNLHFIYIPSIKQKHAKAFIFFFLSSIHFLFKGHYDVAHIHNSDFGLFNLLIWLKRKTKIVSTFHGNPYLRDKWGFLAKNFLKISEFFFLRFSDKLTTVAESKILEVDEKFRSKLVYIPNGIDLLDKNALKAIDNEELLNLEKKSYLMFACGRLDPTKGLHHLIEAFSQINTEVKLLVVGDFSHDVNYTKMILEQVSLDDRIILHMKLMKKNNLFYMVNNSKFFIFPSEIEAMSMMLLEVISLNVPVICSDIIENLAVVGDNYKYQFKNKDAIDLKNKINEMLSEEDLVITANQLFHKVKEEFNWSKIANQYQSIYKQLGK